MRDGWIVTVLGELAEITTGSRAKGGAITLGIPSIGGEQIAEDRSIKFNKMKFIPKDHFESMRTGKLKFGDSLLVKDGATTGKVGYWGYDIPAAVNEHVFILRAKPDCAEPYFINLLISHRPFREEIESRTRGIIGGITRDIENIELVVPPLPEQKRIVDLISSVDSYIEALQQQVESAKRSRNAVLHELLTAGGDDWVEHKLIEMFEIYQPQTIAKSLMSEDGEFIVFGANGPIGRYHEFNHDEPEVVVTCRGATCGTINMTPPKTWITGNAMVVSPKTSGVSKEFLYWALTAGVDIQSVISGSAQPQITREGLAPVKIKIPPLSRQIEIVDLISGFEMNISHLEESLYKTKTLRSGLLSDLLSGEHLIPSSYDKVIGAA